MKKNIIPIHIDGITVLLNRLNDVYANVEPINLYTLQSTDSMLDNITHMLKNEIKRLTVQCIIH